MKKEYYYLCGLDENIESFDLEINKKYTIKELQQCGIVFYNTIPEYELISVDKKITHLSLKYENLEDLVSEYMMIATLPYMDKKYENFNIVDMFYQLCIVIKKSTDGFYYLIDREQVDTVFQIICDEIQQDIIDDLYIDFKPFYDTIDKAVGNFKIASLKFLRYENEPLYSLNIEKKKNGIVLNGSKKNTKIAENVLLKDMFLSNYECLLIVQTDQKFHNTNFNELYYFELGIKERGNIIMNCIPAIELKKRLSYTQYGEFNPEDYNILCDLNGERIF